MRRAARAEGLAEALKALTGLSRDDLIARWVALYGAAPPPRASRSLMIHAAAYKMQERVYGGLSPSTRRALSGSNSTAAVATPPEARPGTVLLREWRGVTHQVTVIEDGVLSSRQTPSLAVRSRAPYHRQPMVGTDLLRSQREGGETAA